MKVNQLATLTFLPQQLYFVNMKIKGEEDVYNIRQQGRLPRSRKSYTMIDLFSGAGGMTLGFTRAFGHNFKVLWANDVDDDCVHSYNKNFGEHCIAGDMVDILYHSRKTIPNADVVVGGPPCQGFSLLNKNREGDIRKQLWRPFIEFVRLSNAKIFVMENVPQLLGSFEHGEITGAAESMGFKVCYAKLCAADYGVPQTRWRAFIMGCNFADPGMVFPPRKNHFNPNGRKLSFVDMEKNGFMKNPAPWPTVRDAINDLPKPTSTEIRKEDPPLDLHFGRKPTKKSRERYKIVGKQGMNRFDLQRIAPELTPDCWKRKTSGGTDLFGRLWWDKPAYTIRTEFFKPEKGRYLHPSQHRPITHREAARLQAFPDNFIFTGSKISIAKQIGNAVPPLLAARIADTVYALLMAEGT